MARKDCEPHLALYPPWFWIQIFDHAYIYHSLFAMESRNKGDVKLISACQGNPHYFPTHFPSFPNRVKTRINAWPRRGGSTALPVTDPSERGLSHPSQKNIKRPCRSSQVNTLPIAPPCLQIHRQTALRGRIVGTTNSAASTSFALVRPQSIPNRGTLPLSRH